MHDAAWLSMIYWGLDTSSRVLFGYDHKVENGRKGKRVPTSLLSCQSFLLKHCPIANSYKECNSDKNIKNKYRHMEKVLFKKWLHPCPRKIVVEIVSTYLVGTLRCLYIKCSQNPCVKNIPTRIVVEGYPQA